MTAKCARCGGHGWVIVGYGETAGADACPVCIEGPEEMKLSFQPPEEDDPRDDDQRNHEEQCLPCPFCGNDKNIAVANEKHDQSGGYFIACPMCDASTGLRYACGEDPKPFLVAQWNCRASTSAKTRSCVGSTSDGGIDDHDESKAWSVVGEVVARGTLGGTQAQVRSGLPVGTKLYAAKAAAAHWPEQLTLTVNEWFAQNTGLGGCSDKDVARLAEIFYSATYEGGRESVDDALAVVDSFGPGIEGLNDTYARQVLLAQEVRRLHSEYIKVVKGRQEMREALRAARDHIDMSALRVSHCKDAALIDGAEMPAKSMDDQTHE